jgi:MscS family membrane protein
MFNELFFAISNINWKQPAVALAIFLVFLLIRRIFVKYVFRIILKISSRTKTELDDRLLINFEHPLRTFIVVLGIYAALAYLPLTAYQNMLLLKFFRAAIIALLAWGLCNMTEAYIFQEIIQKLNFEIDKILLPFLTKVLRFIIIVLAISIIAQEWGYNVSGFVAGLGLGGLAIALAAQDALGNIFGGIAIIMEKPFSIGDWILTPSVEGTVEDITFRSTRVRTFAQALVTVPNATLANEPITNWSRMGKRRITFYLRVTYTTPVAKLRRCVAQIREMLYSHPEIHKETIFVNLDEFSDNGPSLFLYFFTVTTVWGEYLNVKEDVNFRIMEILENEGVSIAFPSRSIYMETPVNYKLEQNKKLDDQKKDDGAE